MVEVWVRTADKRSAGTTGRIGITIVGANGVGGPVVVHHYLDGTTAQARGTEASFLVAMPPGNIQGEAALITEVELSLLDSPARSGAWLPEQVTIEHILTQRTWTFDAPSWEPLSKSCPRRVHIWPKVDPPDQSIAQRHRSGGRNGDVEGYVEDVGDEKKA